MAATSRVRGVIMAVAACIFGSIIYRLAIAFALNADYLTPLGPVYPDYRLGPALGDAPKAYCATCHQGQNKPLGGADAVSAYPSLASK